MVTRVRIDSFLSWTFALMLLTITFLKGSVAAAAMFGIVAVIVGVIALPDRRAFVSDLFCDRWVAVLALFWCVMSFSLFNAGEFHRVAQKALFAKWGEFVSLAIIARYSAKRSGIERPLFFGLVGAAICAADVMFQAATGFDLARHFSLIFTHVGKLYGLTGPFGHYNGLAGYLAPTVIVAIGAAVLVKGVKEKAALSVLSAVMLYSLFFTYSRAGWLSLTAAVLYAGVFAFPRMRGWSFGGVAAAVTTVLLIPGLRERFLRSFAPGGDADRFQIWDAAVQMISAHPFAGVGVGTFMEQMPKYKELGVKFYAHNCYLQIAAETGLIALAVFVSLYALTLIRLHRTKELAAKVLTVVLVALAVILAFDTYLYSVKSAGLFWVLMGFAAGMTANRKIDATVPSA